MTLRDARAAALIRRHRDLADDFTRTLPLLLDALDAIDREHVPDGIIKFEGELTPEQEAEFRAEFYKRAETPPEPPAPTDAQIAAWVERNPKAFADWAARQARTAGTAPTRRRTTRRDGT